MKSLSAMVLALAVAVALVAAPVARADDSDPGCGGYGCQVHNDNHRDLIKGTLLIPAVGYAGHERRKSLRCSDCMWALSPACQDATAGSTAGCLGATINCPGAAVRLFIWRKVGDADWQNVGSACFRPGAPRTVGDITPRVRDKFIDLLPKQHPTFQPKAGGLVNVPVIFAVGQVANLADPTFDLAGFSVTLIVKATWTWDFDDGAPETFAKPGGRYPNLDVTHTYRTSDDRQVTVTTTWDGTFTVDDLGPFDITGAAVTQVSPPMTLPVREAQGQLVAD